MTLKPINPLALQSRATDAPLVRTLWYLAGLGAIVSAATAAARDQPLELWIGQAWVLIVGSIAAFLVTGFFVDRAMRYPGTRSGFVVVPIVIICFLGLAGLLLGARVYYSRPYLGVAFLVTLTWALIRFYVRRKDRSTVLAVIPIGETTMLTSVPRVKFLPLNTPSFEELLDPRTHRARVDGVVADLHGHLDAEWSRFLADCAMRQVPVYHAAGLFEASTGRVSLDHFSEIHLSGAQPPFLFGPTKRLMDVGLCLISLPITLPVMLACAVAIKLDSPGPALFWQDRVGQANRIFRMVKFRTMRHETAGAGEARFAAKDDDRITRWGRFLRRTRLDELPQLWNILRGDMSLIGPRPEQVAFVEKFEREIPFYRLRHFVRPGITGWAQIGSGYASDVQGTVSKLEHDFYYVKYRSLALDLYILYRTVKTVVTGHGAR